MERHGGSFLSSVQSPTHLVDDICDIITKDLHSESDRANRSEQKNSVSSCNLSNRFKSEPLTPPNRSCDSGYFSSKRKRFKEVTNIGLKTSCVLSHSFKLAAG